MMTTMRYHPVRPNTSRPRPAPKPVEPAAPNFPSILAGAFAAARRGLDRLVPTIDPVDDAPATEPDLSRAA